MATPTSVPGLPRVAVIGAGPSGLYAAAALVAGEPAAHVDVFDRLPTPYGLVRYGVAPDHLKMKMVTRLLARPFDRGAVRFFGNVRVGADVSHADLAEHYEAVIYSTGCTRDRTMGIPGEGLAGSVGSGEFVGWYSGHVDRRDLDPVLSHPGVAIVGGGNVALDLARVLAKTAAELAETDAPGHVLDVLRDSRITDIHVVIRRGPADVRFTPAELLQIGQLANADVVLHDDDLLDAADGDVDRRTAQCLQIFRSWRRPDAPGKPRRIHFRFRRTPRAITGEQHVEGLVVERGTGEFETLDVGLVIRAIGYDADPVPGLPVEISGGSVPNSAGRVLQDGAQVPGVYVAGWLKRGPSGVIGTNKTDAEETVRSLIADLPRLARRAAPDVTALLHARGVRYVDWDAWLRIDAAECELGAARGAARVKIAELSGLLSAGAREPVIVGSRVR